jgi:uncharacterized protein YrrD
MVGVLLRHAGWFHSGKGILLAQLKSVGADSITVEDETVIVNEEELVANDQAVLNEEIIGKHIVTTNGKTIGTLSDIYVDTRTGVLTGYEISDSVIKDLLEGRTIIPLPVGQKIGAETVIVSHVVERTKQPVEETKYE